MAPGQSIRNLTEQARQIIQDLQSAHDALNGLSDLETLKIQESVRLTIELMSRITGKPHEIKSTDLDLHLTIDTILHMLAPHFKGVDIHTSIESDATIHTSKIDLLRIIGNLIKNAAEAVKKHDGKKEITITVIRESDNTVFTISDTGPGLPSDVAADPFCPKQREGRGKDHGLGLPSVNKATRMLGGIIKLEKSDNTGTTFKLTLPTNKAAPIEYSLPENRDSARREIRRIIHDVRNGLSHAFAFSRSHIEESEAHAGFREHIENVERYFSNPKQRHAANPQKRTTREDLAQIRTALEMLLKGKHVLVIDDDALDLEILQEVLPKGILKTLTTASHFDTLSAAIARIPEEELADTIVLIDHELPGITGVNLAIELRRTHPTAKRVLHSGVDARNLFKKPGDNPFDAIFPKPLTLQKLLDLMQKLYPQP